MINRRRRLRANTAIRDLVRETILTPKDFVFPIFAVEGENIKEEISSMPGNYHYSVDRLYEIIDEIEKAGIRGVILFGLPDEKDEIGTSAWIDDGIVQRAVRKIKELNKDILVITDICMCQFTSHGHCGIIKDDVIDNDETLDYLGKIAISHAKAGADMVAPSDMMDGRVLAIRNVLDENNFKNVSIMSYSAKYSSAFYGPFREAAHSAPKSGDRKTYQMDPANVREAMCEIEDDIKEGADIVMIKPAISYLDVIRSARDRFDVPIAAYSVSGEFAMVKAAAEKGLINEKSVAMEMLTSIKRAGAHIIITYYAIDACRWLKED
ncbi:porphobilinogen synthase [Clostridium bowmanii]|uniref:porphobilinogen synthase n=1 Tax=Clostridium bowmanii TaxID=132925 RepID=UPI001C0D24E7|nr:porphobilinogen synthase [Clostridium bowmanii]MBU3190244.1 porphobilinogen synthase [Clostridium bowmanii]MCA1074781.1 porphobilinogen synthase [Clostridium bowmanii]